jgi:MtfA peptidase
MENGVATPVDHRLRCAPLGHAAPTSTGGVGCTCRDGHVLKRIRDKLWASRAPRAEPFPDAWAASLWEYSAHYRRLPDRLRAAFEQDVQRFMTTRRITGVEMDVDDRLRLLVAASAATLSAGWRGYTWSEVSEVLLYPADFDRDYAIGRSELAGQAHVWGTVILSVPSLLHSFAYSEDPYHVGVHEFAHLLTYERGLPSAIPVGVTAARIPLWEDIERQELRRVAEGDSIIAAYALRPGEFFTCAVEAFFQTPVVLRENHRRLYGFLSRYFRQLPATWESRRRA